MKSYLRLARSAHRKGCGAEVIRCIMVAAIDAQAFEEGHGIAVEFPREIGDDLVRRLQVGTVTALNRNGYAREVICSRRRVRSKQRAR